MTTEYQFDINSDEVLLDLIRTDDPKKLSGLYSAARGVCDRYYGKKVFFRGLIEFTNYCENNCYYCGIRRDNAGVERYRLTPGQILDCCHIGYDLGFRTFVLQGGEDPYYTDRRITDIVSAIRRKFEDCAITLSIGERSRESYQALFDAGANRFLLRHETADSLHYRRIHPPGLTLESRKRCLWDLKDIGFQVGAGLMVGSPYQTPEALLADLSFLRELEPHMVGIGPFIPQSDTPFGGFPAGTVELTLKMLALTRLILPKALLPATTALGTIAPDGREQALKVGANVVMPNLSPISVRNKYALYDNKICTGYEAAEHRNSLEEKIRRAGFEPDFSRGDHLDINSFPFPWEK